jgi:polygalacturonase
MGRGVLSQRIPLSKKNYQGYEDCPSAIVLVNCTNVLIEGIVQTRAHVNWNIIPIHCDGVTLRDVHVLAPVAVSTDGFNPVNTRNVTVERCFFRVNDDNISPKGDFGVSPENMRLALENITIRDTVFWSHQGRLFSIGPESVTKQIRNIKMQNCDVLYHSGGGTFAILPVYGVEVRDVLLEDIRIETIARPESALFCIGLPSGMGAIVGGTSAASPSIRGVTLRNVTVLQPTPVRCNSIEGWSADKLVQDVLIENFRYGDELILDAKAMGLKTNAWVRNLRFVGPEGK